mmetsp:Transcript_13911/g.21122  ORF Transcript_13911/g.21122 Transcript_13911/m.21122 type:complete len:110 (+) Transcript_13911:162-491(+)
MYGKLRQGKDERNFCCLGFGIPALFGILSIFASISFFFGSGDMRTSGRGGQDRNPENFNHVHPQQSVLHWNQSVRNTVRKRPKFEPRHNQWDGCALHITPNGGKGFSLH